jgi:membrane-bound ClpP family serine protease
MTMTVCVLLIAAGFLLMPADLLIPTGGFLFAAGLAAIAIGLVFIFVQSPTTGMMALVAVFIALPLMFAFLGHYWPRSSMGKRFVLTAGDEHATVASLPVNLDLEQLRGRVGRTLSSLRPAGVVDFDGRRIDTITEGTMIDPDQWVRCIDVKAGKVIVRQVDKPSNLGDLELHDFR